jgi:serine/threonine protein kinase
VPWFDAATYFLTSSYPSAVLAYLLARVVHRFNLRWKNARDIGSYELIERIGAGGMGDVWRAQHRLLARPAAIKLIRGSLLGEAHARVKRWCGASSAKPARRPRSGPPTRSRSTTSASPTKGTSIT